MMKENNVSFFQFIVCSNQTNITITIVHVRTIVSE